MIKYVNIFILLTFSMFFSCKDEFWPELKKYENLLVVDGFLSDQPGPYEVRLSWSTGVQNPQFNPYQGAQVLIMDDEGNSEELTETEPGIYQTAANGLQGVVGKSYKIRINTPTEQTYESNYQLLTAKVGIDSLYVQFESKPTDDPDKMLYGYQFYVDTKEAAVDTAYFLWRIYGTYEYHSDFKIRFYFDKYLYPFPDSDSLFTCWSNDQIDEIYTMSTINLNSPVISQFPLKYVDTETRRLSVKYSMLVKQMSLTKETYDFYNRLAEMNNAQDLLYNSQPYQVKGNIKNMSDDGEPVLGYFLVAGTSEKRIFVDPPSPEYFNYGVCTLGAAALDAYAFIRMTDPRTWPLYVTQTQEGQNALPHQACMDCTQKGGSLKKPVFWED